MQNMDDDSNVEGQVYKMERKGEEERFGGRIENRNVRCTVFVCELG